MQNLQIIGEQPVAPYPRKNLDAFTFEGTPLPDSFKDFLEEYGYGEVLGHVIFTVPTIGGGVTAECDELGHTMQFLTKRLRGDIARGFYTDCGVDEATLNQLIVFAKSKDGDLYCWNSTEKYPTQSGGVEYQWYLVGRDPWAFKGPANMQQFLEDFSSEKITDYFKNWRPEQHYKATFKPLPANTTE